MYTHNYEKLTIPEAQSIIAGTFVQGTTSIPGECITRLYTSTLVSEADKSITSIYPETGDDKELVCWFETQDNRVDPESVEVDDIVVYTNETKDVEYTLYPYGASPADGTTITWTLGEGYETYITSENHTTYLTVTGVARTGDENKIPYSVKVGDLTSNTAYIIVKDLKDQQLDMLNQGNIITLVYNLTDIGVSSGGSINVYSPGKTNPILYRRVDYVWAVSTSGVTLDDVNPFLLPIKNVSNNVYRSNEAWLLKITDDMIVDGNKVVLYLQFDKSTTTIPAELEYENPDIEKIYIPNPYDTFERAMVYKNSHLTTIITGTSVDTLNQNCMAYLPSLKNIYIGSSAAPTLKQTYYPGFTFIDVENGNLKTTASNVIIHVPSTATGYDASETDVWKWPGCFKATTGTNAVRYGIYSGRTFQLATFTENVAAASTWSISKDYDPATLLYILYDRDPVSGAKKLN